MPVVDVAEEEAEAEAEDRVSSFFNLLIISVMLDSDLFSFSFNCSESSST